MTEPLEIEAKFEFDPADRQRLLDASSIGRFAVSDRTEVMQDDTYYDTVDALLKRAGATFRVRRTASGARMTFKGPRQASTSSDDAHIASRLEDEVRLSLEQTDLINADGPLPEMAGVSPLDRARALVGSGQLVPVAQLRNARVTLALASGTTSLELAVDDCVGTRLADGRTVAFDEVELEAKSGDRAVVLEASTALQEYVPSLRPSQRTKLGRTLD